VHQVAGNNDSILGDEHYGVTGRMPAAEIAYLYSDILTYSRTYRGRAFETTTSENLASVYRRVRSGRIDALGVSAIHHDKQHPFLEFRVECRHCGSLKVVIARMPVIRPKPIAE
jgi:hypothetical protein